MMNEKKWHFRGTGMAGKLEHLVWKAGETENKMQVSKGKQGLWKMVERH